MQKIVLATTATCRKKAFALLDLDFMARGSNVDEYSEGRPDTPKELVLHLAKLKALSVAKHYKSEIVIGFDSVGWFRGRILEKPKSKKEAFERLRSLSSKTHQFYTGIYMMNLESGKNLSRAVVTDIQMRKLQDFEIDKYLKQDRNFKKQALGYDPFGHYSSTFVKRIKGSYNNLIRGIPLEVIIEMLLKVGYKI